MRLKIKVDVIIEKKRPVKACWIGRLRNQVTRDLVYDVGMHDGSDTAYYLHRGFRVVAIEANPLLVEAANTRFEKEIASGRLTVINTAIHSEPGEATFWVSEMSECSSFNHEAATRHKPARPVVVKTEMFDTIIERYGIPYYLKLDIEGMDEACIGPLKGRTSRELPRYISLEAQPDGPETSLTFLRKLGYMKFKVIQQAGDFRPMLRYLITRKHKWAYLPSRIKHRILREKWELPHDWKFTSYSSGPLPEEAPGDWQSLESLQRDWRRWLPIAEESQWGNAWYDFHAAL